ncbi:MAG TPA: dihydroxyacetone kinase subunit L, partial [SAR324 cluster bacterium]|nr:dihydroxyacetone kinase subunit L [SAR324 cluster bacterium]
VQKRGKAEAGEKTMLDVLIPAVKQLDKDIENGSLFKETIENVIKASEEGLESTKAMKALKGRASYLGERSIGHLDPGAMSSSLLIKAVCRVLNEKSNSKIDD